MYLTEDGKIYYGKLCASKNFLKEYSLISKKNIKDEKIWGSYIKNAILFDLKGNLDNDAKNYYKEIIDKYKYKENIQSLLSKKSDIIVWIILLFPWFFLLLVGNNNIDKQIFNLILSNFIINPFIFIFFINKDNPKAVK